MPSFEIENFRTFSHLRIGHLGKVNLVVGRNNIGKTMLLEAIRFYASGGNPTVLVDLLYDRDELLLGGRSDDESSNPHLHFASLFFGRSTKGGTAGAAKLQTSLEDPASVRVEIGLFRRISSKDTLEGYRIESVGEEEHTDELGTFQAITIFLGKHKSGFLPLDTYDHIRYGRSRGFRPDSSSVEYSFPAFVPASGVDHKTLARQWDAIALHDAEERVNKCLEIVAPVARITAVEHPDRSRSRMFMVRMKEKAVPVSLKSVGDGMFRIFQIALALESAKNGRTPPVSSVQKPLLPDLPAVHPTGVLLVDEIENGIHFSVLPDLWRFVFQAARLHNVQVFATAHSWDCVEAFQSVAAEEKDVDGTLIRLEKEGDRNKAVTFSEEELAIATRDGIEVR